MLTYCKYEGHTIKTVCIILCNLLFLLLWWIIAIEVFAFVSHVSVSVYFLYPKYTWFVKTTKRLIQTTKGGAA